MFSLLARVAVERDAASPPLDVAVYRSASTGLTVALADVEGPLVNGFLAVATEALDDDGCPHTLEHLVFLGSETYPFKGLLDRVANRCLAQGTNAWTETDHTAYTLSTAGPEGFLQLLPVYLDHVLYPTLTDSGCHTEVHYVTGEGQDAGVVYSEMQGRENGKDDLLQLRLKRVMYPEPSGYRSETGGLMKNLRSLTAETIRKYHGAYYRPDNLCVIITGKMDHQRVFAALEPVEQKIVAKKSSLSSLSSSPVSFKRPWVDSPPVPPFVSIVEEFVDFPDEDETVGTVYLSWRGPHFHQYLELSALDVVWTYLTDSPVSLLQKNFVEIPSPLCSDVDVSDFYNLETMKCVTFENVPVEHLNSIRNLFFDVILKHLEEGLDMQRIALIIERSLRHRLESLETSPHYLLAMNILGNFLYGNVDGSQLRECLDDLAYLRILQGYTREKWTSLIREYIINRPYACLKGKPSAKLAKENAEQELQRVEEQRKLLGPERLKQLEQELADAIEKNSTTIPESLLLSFKIPSTDTISFFPIKTFKPQDPHFLSRNDLPALISKEAQQCSFPFADFQLDDINSIFVEMTLYIDTSDIPLNLRLYLELFLDVMFSLPVSKNGVVKPFEQVVRELDEDTVSYSNSVGINGDSDFNCGPFQDQILIAIKCEREKYLKGVAWLADVLFHSQFTLERLKSSVKTLLHSIPDHRREGYEMANMALKSLIFDQSSNHSALNVLVQQSFLKKVKAQLRQSEEPIVRDLDSLRKALCDPWRFRVHVVGRFENVESPILAWKTIFLNSLEQSGMASAAAASRVSPSPLKWSQDYLNSLGQNPSNQGLIIHLPTTDSAFSNHITTGPKSYEDADYPVLLVLAEYLTTMEGPFWRDIRGQGLAYSCSFHVKPEEGLINFGLYRATDVGKAFEKAKQIVESLESGKSTIDAKDLGGAQSAVLFSLVAKYENISGAATQSFINQGLKKLPPDSLQQLLRKVQMVTVEDLVRVLRKYIRNIFDPSTCVSSVVVSPAKIDDALEKFKALGYDLQQLRSLDDVWPEVARLHQTPLLLPVHVSSSSSASSAESAAMDTDGSSESDKEDDEDGDDDASSVEDRDN